MRKIRRYDALCERCRLLGLTVSPRRNYAKASRKLKDFIDDLMNAKCFTLPEKFTITVDYVASIVDPSGKRLYIEGKNLKIVQWTKTVRYNR